MANNKKLFYKALPAVIGFVVLLLAVNREQYTAMASFPPLWLFGALWLVMYFAAGTGAYRANRYLCSSGHAFYFTQLLLSYVWMLFLFRIDVRIAFAVIVLCVGFSLSAMREYYHCDRRAAYWILPYNLWLIALAIINFAECIK